MSNGTLVYFPTPAWCPIVAVTISLPVTLPIIAFMITFLVIYTPKVFPCVYNLSFIRRLSGGRAGEVYQILQEVAQKTFYVYVKFVGLDMSINDSDEQRAAYMGMLEEEGQHREAVEDGFREAGPDLASEEIPESDIPRPGQRTGIIALLCGVSVIGAIVSFFSMLLDVCLIYFSLRLVGSALVPADIEVMRAEIPSSGFFLNFLNGMQFDTVTEGLLIQYRCYSLKLSLALWVLVVFLRLLRAMWMSDLPWSLLAFGLRQTRVRQGTPGRPWKRPLAEAGFTFAVAGVFVLTQTLWQILPSVLWVIADLYTCPEPFQEDGVCIPGTPLDQTVFRILVPFFFALIIGGLLPLLWRSFAGTGFALPPPERVKCCPGSQNLEQSFARWGVLGRFVATVLIFGFAMAHAVVAHMNALIGVWNSVQINAHELDAKTSKVLGLARPRDSGHEDLYNRQAESRKARRATLRVLLNSLALFWIAFPGCLLLAKVAERLNHTLIFYSGEGADVGVEDSNVYDQPIRWVNWFLNLLRISLVLAVVFSPSSVWVLLFCVVPEFFWDLFLLIRIVPKTGSARLPEPEANTEVDI